MQNTQIAKSRLCIPKHFSSNESKKLDSKIEFYFTKLKKLNKSKQK